MDKFDKIINELKKDIKIPDTVMSKYTNTLSSVSETSDNDNVCTHRRLNKKRFIPAIALVAAITGAVTVSAATYSQWSKSFDDLLRPTEAQKTKLEESDAVRFYDSDDSDNKQTDAGNKQNAANSEHPETGSEQNNTTQKLSDTVNGVTISVQQSIADNYAAWISLKIEGYTPVEIPEAQFTQPVIRDVQIDIDGASASSESCGFYSEYDIDNNQWNYIQEDGSLEYNIKLYSFNKGTLLGRTVHIEMSDFGYETQKAQAYPAIDLEGTWTLDVTLGGTDSLITTEPNTPIGDSGATLLYAEISPLAALLKIEYPQKQIVETDVDDRGKTVTFYHTETPPQLVGIKLKDGTIKETSSGGGFGSYLDEKSPIYRQILYFNTYADGEEIDSLLFFKSLPEQGQPYTEDICYVVPLN